jgi:hypothetical protein
MTGRVLYRLEPITDNPKYEGFAFVREESIRENAVKSQNRLAWDFGANNMQTAERAWTVLPLTPFWTPQPVIGRVRPFNDYPCVNLTVPAFSRRAVDALRDLLEPNGELLPLDSPLGEYFAYNTTTVADVLDLERSKVRWLNGEHILQHIYEIEHYECFAERIDGLSIFLLVEKPSPPHVTQLFVDRVHQCGLQGFHFVKVWPWTPSVSWREENRKQRKKELKVKTKKASIPIKGNSLVLLFSTSETEPNKAEKDQLAQLMDEIDGLLYDPKATPDAPYLGSLEGDDHHAGKIRLFLSCPDADALVEKLRPWLTTLSWPGQVQAVKRYGEFADPDCREEAVEL